MRKLFIVSCSIHKSLRDDRVVESDEGAGQSNQEKND